MPEYPRPLTEEEKGWLREALALLPTGEYMARSRWRDPILGGTMPLDLPIDPEPYLAQIDDLVVTSRCPCGDPRCHTVTVPALPAGQERGPGAHHYRRPAAAHRFY